MLNLMEASIGSRVSQYGSQWWFHSKTVWKSVMSSLWDSIKDININKFETELYGTLWWITSRTTWKSVMGWLSEDAWKKPWSYDKQTIWWSKPFQFLIHRWEVGNCKLLVLKPDPTECTFILNLMNSVWWRWHPLMFMLRWNVQQRLGRKGHGVSMCQGSNNLCLQWEA